MHVQAHVCVCARPCVCVCVCVLQHWTTAKGLLPSPEGSHTGHEATYTPLLNASDVLMLLVLLPSIETTPSSITAPLILIKGAVINCRVSIPLVHTLYEVAKQLTCTCMRRSCRTSNQFCITTYS